MERGRAQWEGEEGEEAPTLNIHPLRSAVRRCERNFKKAHLASPLSVEAGGENERKKKQKKIMKKNERAEFGNGDGAADVRNKPMEGCACVAAVNIQIYRILISILRASRDVDKLPFQKPWWINGPVTRNILNASGEIRL